MIQFLPYALAAYGGYRGYKDSKDQGIGGINETFKEELDNLMRSGLSRDAARAIIMGKYGF